MFEKSHVPPQNNAINNCLNAIYAQASGSGDVKSVIEKKIDKVDQGIKDKIVQTVTVSEYFDKLWKQLELKQNDKDYVIKKLEAIQFGKKSMIRNGEMNIAATPANLDVVNAEFKMTSFEEYNLQEKVKEVRKARKLDIDNGVIAHIHGNLDILHALNRPFRSVQNSSAPHLHYVGGLCEAEEDLVTKTKKANEFIKKIKRDKREFTDAIRKAEKSQEARDLEDLERLRKKEREEEEQKRLERIAEHEAELRRIDDYKDERLHKRAKHEDEYVSKLDKKPMFKDIEKKFKQGYIIPELQERKKKLAEIRDFHKPITTDNIHEHKEKVTKMYEEALHKRKAETEAQLKAQLDKNPMKKPEFESPHHKMFAEEVSKVRHSKEHERMELLKRKEKVMELLQDVKENHIPKADPQKEAELMNIVNELNQRNKRKDHRSRTADGDGDSDDSLDPRKIGANYLQSVKEMVQKKKEQMAKAAKEKGEHGEHGEGTGRDSTKPKALTETKSATIVRKNYLVELRQDNKIGKANSQVDNIIKNKSLGNQEKKALLQTEVEKLEEKARRMELVRKVKHNNKPFENAAEDDEVDQLYIKTIKAKLEMLGN